jgi:hypothetical protein
MRSLRTLLLGALASLTASAFAVGCSNDAAPADEAAVGEDAITSTDGQPLEFRFEAEVVTSRDMPVKNAVVAQLEYLQGALTADKKANVQFRFVDVQNPQESDEGAAKKRIKYSGSVAVIFPAGERVPTRYDLAMPLDVTDLAAFNAKYDGKCGNNEYGQETFWHDWNPRAEGCTLGADVARARASVRRHPLGTTDKYPEYDQIWKDGRLDIVAVYGAISNTTDSDSGARERESFIAKLMGALTGAAREDIEPRGGILKHSVVTGKTRVGSAERDVRLVAYFVEEAQYAGAEFEASYAEETAKADFVHYSGHSGLGKNIAALSKSTKATAGKYQIAYFNGCQTLGYLGPWMHEARRTLNGESADPNGTKFLDVIVTSLPAYSESTPSEQILFDAFVEQQKGWQDLLRSFAGEQWTTHMNAVFGEDDNAFRPQ